MSLTPKQSKYTRKDIEEVFALMRTGLSLRKSCQKLGTISKSTFLDIVRVDKELADQYARARDEMLDVQADMLEDIGEEAAQADNKDRVAGLRLQSDNRKWLLSKLAPKKYGDKLDLSSSDGSMTPKEFSMDFSKLSTAALTELLALKDATERE